MQRPSKLDLITPHRRLTTHHWLLFGWMAVVIAYFRVVEFSWPQSTARQALQGSILATLAAGLHVGPPVAGTAEARYPLAALAAAALQLPLGGVLDRQLSFEVSYGLVEVVAFALLFAAFYRFLLRWLDGWGALGGVLLLACLAPYSMTGFFTTGAVLNLLFWALLLERLCNGRDSFVGTVTLLALATANREQAIAAVLLGAWSNRRQWRDGAIIRRYMIYVVAWLAILAGLSWLAAGQGTILSASLNLRSNAGKWLLLFGILAPLALLQWQGKPDSLRDLAMVLPLYLVGIAVWARGSTAEAAPAYLILIPLCLLPEPTGLLRWVTPLDRSFRPYAVLMAGCLLVAVWHATYGITLHGARQELHDETLDHAHYLAQLRFHQFAGILSADSPEVTGEVRRDAEALRHGLFASSKGPDIYRVGPPLLAAPLIPLLRPLLSPVIAFEAAYLLVEFACLVATGFLSYHFLLPWLGHWGGLAGTLCLLFILPYTFTGHYITGDLITLLIYALVFPWIRDGKDTFRRMAPVLSWGRSTGSSWSYSLA